MIATLGSKVLLVTHAMFDLQDRVAVVTAGSGVLGTLLWLATPPSTVITGIVVPVDGGVPAFGGARTNC